MRIDKIVLNWNRKELLEQYLQSYAAMIDKACQLIVLDNGKSDGSREVIARLCKELSCLKPIFLGRNLEVRPSASRWRKPPEISFTPARMIKIMLLAGFSMPANALRAVTNFRHWHRIDTPTQKPPVS
jgi:GT2 family glycosyltransferase